MTGIWKSLRKDRREFKASKESKVSKESKASRESKANKESKASKVFRVNKASKVRRVNPELTELMARVYYTLCNQPMIKRTELKKYMPFSKNTVFAFWEKAIFM